ncbi:pirin family protein [Solimonas soli]|uniref:pirin family protein n=1 Tax=Solimonas soli TaxID=413479 RepID=UPI0004813C83|nr:pirin family protein [Solimonas soli]
MISFIPGESRGHAEHGWLDARHSFSFSSYYDPQRMGYGALRVINEDRVVPTAGFPPHGHRDMEIITYVLDGELKHRDSLGSVGALRHGEIQVMSAGRGIQHSEYNGSAREPLHLLQIWIEPAITGKSASYGQGALDAAALRGGFSAVVGPRGADTPFHIDQDAWLHIAWPAAGAVLEKALDTRRRYYLHLARGAIRVGAQRLVAGDALTLEGETALRLQADGDDAEILLFDLA